MARDASLTRASKGPDTGGKPVNKTDDVARELSVAFEQIEPANYIYQEEITPCEAPDIYMYDDIEIIGLPLGRKQAAMIVEAALEGDFNAYDTDATSFPKEPACVFNPGSFDIQNPRWDRYVQELAISAVAGIGLGDCEVKAELDGLWLWTENCTWPTPVERRRNGDNRRTWGGKMLIVLPSAHEGGEITFARQGGPVLLPTDAYRQSMVCWYKGTVRPQFKPPTKGNRLALLYDLHVPSSVAQQPLWTYHHRAVQALQDAIEKYTVFVRRNIIEEMAFFLPLRSKVPIQGPQQGNVAISKDILLPCELGKVECFSEKGMDEIRGFQTHIALAVLTARDRMTIFRVEGEERIQRSATEYTLDKVVGIDGGDDLGEPLRHLGGAKLSKESILDADAFNSNITRLVTKQGGTEEHVFLKSVLCLMMHFEETE